jgi:hypothetical protein
MGGGGFASGGVADQALSDIIYRPYVMPCHKNVMKRPGLSGKWFERSSGRSNGQCARGWTGQYICYSRNGTRAAGSVIFDVLDYSRNIRVTRRKLEKFFDVNQYSRAIFDVFCVGLRARENSMRTTVSTHYHC